MGFQTTVGVQPAPAVAGDFASANPRWNVLAGPGGLVAGVAGVTVGRFAWLSSSAIDQDNAPTILNSFGSGPVAGFIGRHQQALITDYLADSGMRIPKGFGVTAYSGGDFWAQNDGASAVVASVLTPQYAYANLADGRVSFAAANSAATASGSTSTVAAATFSATGTITGNVLTVSAVGSGSIYPGSTISGTNVASGSQIVAQLSGTPGGVGTYAVSIGEQAVASTTISGTYGLLTIGGTVTGTFATGGLISGTGTSAGTYITAPISGSGGAGTYAVNNNAAVSSTAISATTNVQTKFFAMSSGAPGELVKITSHTLG
jgi:hypothetical protein